MKLGKIYNEDCVRTMKRMTDSFLDLVVTSPPYDKLRDYGKTYNKNDEIFSEVISELYRVIKQGGVVVWVVNDSTIRGGKTGTSFRQALAFIDAGFLLYDTMIFYKKNPMPTAKRYYDAFEYMFVFSKGRPKTINLIKIKSKHGGKRSTGTRNVGNTWVNKTNNTDRVYHNYKNRCNVWPYAVGRDKLNRDCGCKHPAVFPEKLVEDHIKSWSNEGDIVYDPFSGSGTVGAMAVKLNRKFILSEINSDYLNTIFCKLSYVNATVNKLKDRVYLCQK